MEFVRVTSVDVLGHYKLRLSFSDGSTRDVDLMGELHCPVFEPLADPDYFAQVQVDDQLGTLVWPNGADLDPPRAARGLRASLAPRPPLSDENRRPHALAVMHEPEAVVRRKLSQSRELLRPREP
jgi:hypothetical protein